MKKANRFGFTLIELLAIMVILGVVMTIAFVAVGSLVKKGKIEYYHGLEVSLKAAGQDYILDYRSLLPREIGNTTVITGEELIKNHYIDEIVDEEKKACDATVTVEKTGKQSYEYYVCLKCSSKYTSDQNSCELVGNNHQAKNYTINLNGDLKQVVNQCEEHTIPSASVYQNGENGNQLITNSLLSNPKSIDTTVLGETSVTWSYRYKSISKTVRVVDSVPPIKPVIKIVYPNGAIYQPSGEQGIIVTNRALILSVASRDYACPLKYPNLGGSGLASIQYKNQQEEKWTKVNTTKNTTNINITDSLFGTIDIKAIDKYGNESEITNFDIYVDRDIPSKTIVTYLGGSNSHSWKNNYKLQLSAIDNIKVAYFEVDWDNDGIVDETTSDIYIPQNNFSFCKVRFRAVDLAGNRGEWSDTQDIHMDTEKPSKTTVNLGSYTSDTWTNQNVTQKFSATDNVDVDYYEYVNSIDESTATKISNPWTIDWDGVWDFYVRAVDLAGNRGEWSNMYTVKRDTVKPSCTIKVTNTPNMKDDWYIDEVQIGFETATDDSNSIKSAVIDRPTIIKTSASGDTITGTITDSAGNVNTCTLFLKVDAVVPTIVFNSDPLGTRTPYTFTDNIKEIKYGPLGGTSNGCNPDKATDDNKPTSSTCSATGNNGKTGTNSFTVKYSYPAVPVYHQHTGSSSSGGGCYTIANKSSRTCGAIVSSSNGGSYWDSGAGHLVIFCKNGHAHCGSEGSNEGAPNMEGASCNATITYITGYSLGCGKTANVTIDSYSCPNGGSLSGTTCYY